MGQQRVKDMTETPNKASQEETLSGAGKGRGKKAAKKQVPTGRAYIRATYNNTLITFTDASGNALVQYSAGQAGFKGPKKSTPYAAGIIVSNAAGKVRDYGLKEVNVFVKGVGGGREAAIRALNSNGINVLSIKDITPIPHNGPRPKKPRRV
ncbi:30S ribosomal protein S11 [Candidatus Falkowbacteria bacterium]|nr:30S ribosomal protein S11 [Candidatus Falkowbacteria bacterium]